MATSWGYPASWLVAVIAMIAVVAVVALLALVSTVQPAFSQAPRLRRQKRSFQIS
jgi:hypothetical protein